MATYHSLEASRYVGIRDRRKDFESVRRELNVVINALPTQINPTERERYLDTLLADLEPKQDSIWTSWPDDVYLLALTAVKSLGRNPVGSETLLTTTNLATILYHTALPISSTTSSNQIPSAPSQNSPQALEALRILANLLVLHAAGRNRFAKAGGAVAIARALARKDGNGQPDEAGDDVDRVFLLGRIGFLVTMERAQAVEEMVDKEDVINSLVYYLTSITPIPAHFAVLSELLKLVNNLLRFYPYNSTSSEQEPWDERLDALLYPTLILLHTIPFTDLSPPLTHTLHVLLSIPFIPKLLPTWHSIPDIRSTSPPSSSVKALLSKIGGKSQHLRRGSKDAYSSAGGPSRTTSPTPASPRLSDVGSRKVSLPPSKTDPSALPIRVMMILDEFLDTYLPFPTKPDDELQPGLVLDEVLPPVLLLLTRAAAGSEPIRVCLKERLLPSSLDRSPAAGPLESRRGLLGNLLRLMACSSHLQGRDTAGELLWAVCDGDASTLSVEIGYGNAAGLLFRKGISGPPPARIEEILEPLSSQSTLSSHAEQRHPITSLRPAVDTSSPLDAMTQEEKEREAERLLVLFDRMEKNSIISASTKDGQKGIKDAMREKMESGVGDEWDEAEKRRVGEEDDRDEEEARKEMEAYRRRTGRS